MKNSNDTIWNRTRDLLACSAVPQPNVQVVCNNESYVSEWAKYRLFNTGRHFSGINRTARHPDLQKIRIIGFFFENRLYWQFEEGNKFLQTVNLCYIFVYVQTEH